jgi:hypothetical protein
VSDSFNPDADAFSVFAADKNGKNLFVGDEMSYLTDIFKRVGDARSF